MSAHPKLDEQKLNDPVGLILRYQANLRLGADFYFPEEFSKLSGLLDGAVRNGRDKTRERLTQAVSLFDRIDRQYESRAAEVRGLLEGFIHTARQWAGDDIHTLRGLEKARCRLTFGNPRGALREVRSVLDHALADARRSHAAPNHHPGITSITARALPLERLFTFLDKAQQVTAQHRYLALLDKDRLQAVGQWFGAPVVESTGALLVRAVHDRSHVSYLICMDVAGEGWGEAVERLPRWEGAWLQMEAASGLRAEVALMEHLLRIVPVVHGELLLADTLEGITGQYPHLKEQVGFLAAPKDEDGVRTWVQRVVEGRPS